VTIRKEKDVGIFQDVESISTQAPVEKAYEALTDWKLRSQWRKGAVLEWEGGSKAHVGQVLRTRVQGFPSYSFTYRITGLEAPSRIYMEYMGKPLQGRAGFEIVPVENGCQVSFYWMKVEPKGFFSRLYFAMGLGMSSHRARSRETLRMLKEYLEKAGA
jgi:hypothetical protein